MAVRLADTGNTSSWFGGARTTWPVIAAGSFNVPGGVVLPGLRGPGHGGSSVMPRSWQSRISMTLRC